MPDPNQTVRIFISSPGDVVEERDGAKRVIEGLQKNYPKATLKPVLWEDLALPATASFQETIDFLLEREPIDIAVFILWSRLGSPLGASITRPDGTSYRSGTEREFDLMLAGFEQSGRTRPVILAYVRDDYESFTRKLTEYPETELSEVVKQRELAESFIVEHFHDSEGRNLRAYQTYSEPIDFLQRLRVHLRRAIDNLLDVDSAVTWSEEPYRGLETFDIEHAPIFYGREEEACDLLQRLRDQQSTGCAFVVLVGASGSGKSSLARAGVAANLVQHPDDEGVQWRVTALIPTLTDQSLHHTLVRSLAEVLPELVDSDATVDRIAIGLAENPKLTVDLAFTPAFDSAYKSARLLLILDQMEELWTDRHTTEQERESFLAAIKSLADSGHVAVLATLRSDFYPHAQQSPSFLQLKGKLGHVDLLAPDAASIHRLITEPARLAGLKFEQNQRTGRSLDDVILHDAADDPNSLPLLEYTLSELYRQRDQDRGLLTYAAYVELGGVEGAIGKRAEETFQSLPPDARAALDETLPLLVSVDVAGEQSAVRRRASVDDLTSTPARMALAEQLTAQRFLTTDREGETPIASLAHEALLRCWDRIVHWINVNREHLLKRARVEQCQQRWEQQKNEESLLLVEGVPLDEGRQLLDKAQYLLSTTTMEYILASTESHMQRTSRNRRRKRNVVVCFVALLTSIAFGSYRMHAANQRERTESLVHAVSNARGLVVSYAINDLNDLPRTLVLEELGRQHDAADDVQELALTYALACFGDVRVSFLVSQVERLPPGEVDNVWMALANANRESLDALAAAADQCDQVTIEKGSEPLRFGQTPTFDENYGVWRKKARLGMLALCLGDSGIAADMCRHRPNPVQRTIFIDECSTWCGDLSQLNRVLPSIDDASLRSAVCLVLGSLPDERFEREAREAIETCRGILFDWHRCALDGGTHGASGWALRKWKTHSPELSSVPVEASGLQHKDRQWHVNGVGLTMLSLPAGSFSRVVGGFATEWEETTRVADPFMISSFEVSLRLFQQFVGDEDYPSEKRPIGWGPEIYRGETPEQPIVNANWDDAVMFCNWLSWKEGRRACYRLESVHEKAARELRHVEQRIESGVTHVPHYDCFLKSTLLFHSGRYEQARSAFTQCREFEGYRASATKFLAILLARAGETAEARLLLQQLVDGAPESEQPVQSAYLAMIVESWLGNGQQAFERLKKEMRSHSGDSSFIYSCACACSMSSLAAAYNELPELEAELKEVALTLLAESLELGESNSRLQDTFDLYPLGDEAGFVALLPNDAPFSTWAFDERANGYRLPTVAEWRFACRAGTTTRFSFGEDQAWIRAYGIGDADRSEECGSKMPNGWGLFDMHGNASEWCNDLDYEQLFELAHFQCGGYYGGNASQCSSDAKSRHSTRLRSGSGFRVAINQPKPAIGY